MNIKFQTKSVLLYVCIVAWALCWCIYTAKEIKARFPYYRMALGSSSDSLRQYHAIYDSESRDYYSIIKYCDESLPPEAHVRLIVPEKPHKRYAFLTEKGRYFLYPRNFGNNSMEAEYILVYGVKDFLIPKNYKKYISFSEDKYLLVKADP